MQLWKLVDWLWRDYSFLILVISIYRSEQGLELDLFLLQCCAALAPADSYVDKLLSRFGLSSYLSLNPDITNEYVPIVLLLVIDLIIWFYSSTTFDMTVSSFHCSICIRGEQVFYIILWIFWIVNLFITRWSVLFYYNQSVLPPSDMILIINLFSGMNQFWSRKCLVFWYRFCKKDDFVVFLLLKVWEERSSSS